MPRDELAGQKVTLMGLGRHGGGVAAARWLATQGALVTVTDLRDERALADSLAELNDVPIAAWHLAAHCEADFTGADLVVVNPAVRPDNRFIAAARAADVRITSEIDLFLERCPATVIGVTGSNGKSTTAAMIADILKAGRRTWLGGNIGRSLLGDLPDIAPADYVVLELSSFQLDWLGPDARWPQVVVITNCTPNHLDWHGTLDAYIGAKQRLLRHQTTDAAAILNMVDPLVRGWRHLVRGRLLAVEDDREVPLLHVPGNHNRRNAACAAAAASAVGCSPAAIADGLASFRGLAHRLELVGEVSGRRFYNDSMATTPESVIAALDTFAGGWFLVGGHDKGFDYADMASRLARDASGVACYGAARGKIAALIARAPRRRCALDSFELLDDALAWCWSRASESEAIVLSPACASYDQFRDYRDRGEKFISLVRALADCCASRAR